MAPHGVPPPSAVTGGLAMSAPVFDLHDALTILAPHGWLKSCLQPGIWRPVGKNGAQSLRTDIGGRFLLWGTGLPLGGVSGTLTELVEQAKAGVPEETR